MKNVSLTVYDQKLLQYIHSGFDIELLDSNCGFTEGPVWNPAGYYLFSDIPRNIICRIVPGEDKTIFLSPSGYTHGDRDDLTDQVGSNGLAYDERQRLVICQHGNHAVAIWDGETTEALITRYADKPFNSPNDVVVHMDGRIFFSDPPYGLKGQQLHLGKYQSKAGIYCWNDGVVQLFCDRYQFPNGVCLSPDERVLYTCSSKSFEAALLAWDAHSLQLIGKVADENSDGMKCDAHGNLYLASREGIVILNKKGARLGKIALPKQPANLCWGGESRNDLFVTARENIYLIRNLQRG